MCVCERGVSPSHPKLEGVVSVATKPGGGCSLFHPKGTLITAKMLDISHFVGWPTKPNLGLSRHKVWLGQPPNLTVIKVPNEA